MLQIKLNPDYKPHHHPHTKRLATMASFDFAIAIGFPVLNKSDVSSIKSFLAAPKYYYYNILNKEGQTQFIKFLVDVKILGNAKRRLGDFYYEDFSSFEAACLTKIPYCETATYLRQKLTTSRQGSRSINEFADDLQDLAERLLETTMRECSTFDRDTVKNVYYATALNVFKRNMRPDIRIFLAIAKPTSIEEALTIVKESGLEKHPIKQNYLQQRREQHYQSGRQWAKVSHKSAQPSPRITFSPTVQQLTSNTANAPESISSASRVAPSEHTTCLGSEVSSTAAPTSTACYAALKAIHHDNEYKIVKMMNINKEFKRPTRLLKQNIMLSMLRQLATAMRWNTTR